LQAPLHCFCAASSRARVLEVEGVAVGAALADSERTRGNGRGDRCCNDGDDDSCSREQPREVAQHERPLPRDDGRYARREQLLIGEDSSLDAAARSCVILVSQIASASIRLDDRVDLVAFAQRDDNGAVAVDLEAAAGEA
jgi:hypothetical protein